MTRVFKSVCKGTKRNGDPCGCPATLQDEFCFWHSPRVTPEEKRLAAMKGGLASRPTVLPPETGDVRLNTPESCLALLEDTISRTRRGELDVKIANSVAYQITAACKVWVVAISDKLDRLEKMVNGKVRRRC